MAFVWIVVGIGIAVLVLGIVVQFIPDDPDDPDVKTVKEPPVELCTSEHFEHSWEAWGVPVAEDKYSNVKTTQYRRCENCGLSQRRRINTIK